MEPLPSLEPPFLVFPLPDGSFRLYAEQESLWPGESLEEAAERALALQAHLAGGLRYSRYGEKARGFWGVYPSVRVLSSEELSRIASPFPVLVGPLEAGMDGKSYSAAFATIKDALAAGSAYQADLTFPLKGKAVSAPPWSWRCALRLWLELLEPGGDRLSGQGRQASFTAEKSGEIVASLSPELFFSLDGDLIRSRPMKGTAPRDPDPATDLRLKEGLHRSEKNRAENLMITDMVRNDLGRVAKSGGVRVTSAFEIESYPSLWQMTSTVEADLARGTKISELMEAMFPCASITGAPKIAAQGIIAMIEPEERGWYTGTMGWYAPAAGKREKIEACFSVLIRSLVFPRSGDPGFLLGVGGGIVWDSEAESEYEEALSKSKFLLPAARRFDLLESMLWEKDSGFFLQAYHAERLSKSCLAFGGRLDETEFDRTALAAVEAALAKGQEGPLKLRILVDPNFRLRAEAAPLEPTPVPLRCAVSERRLGPESAVYRLWKTNERGLFSGAREAGVDQLIFLNEKGELTESTSMNIVLERDGAFTTPASSSVLLEGCYRRLLLETGRIREAVLYEKDLREADAVWLINSVRRWVRATLLR
jgi:para-aminobenzoate synthetase / 4-amino-4-deoxychorismate lyase